MMVNDTLHSWYQSSDYLSSIARQYPQLLSNTLSETTHSTSDFSLASKNLVSVLQTLITQVKQLEVDENRDVDKDKQTLRTLKAHFDWYWSYCRLQHNLQYSELQQKESFKTLGRLRTEFADATIDKALEIVWQQGKASGLIKRSADDKPTGLFIWGMGKLGGYDLNFSSDIDLIAFYDAATFPIHPMAGAADVANKLLKQCTQILSQTIDNQFVWRVDWRLRPDASVATLAMPMNTGINFYRFRSLPWHRLALLKARVVAGDIALGHSMLNRLESYIWREYLDMTVFDDVYDIKEKINQEHPQLKAERRQSDDIVQGFNVKLGRGGIRDIEFIANCLQLLWGGKKISLQVQYIGDIYHAIAELGLLPQSTVNELLEAYQQFRLIEDALQIIGNQQRHSIPTEPLALQRLIQLLSTELSVKSKVNNDDELNSDQRHSNKLYLMNIINRHRQIVTKHYEQFFSQLGGYRQVDEQYNTEENNQRYEQLIQSLSDNNQQIVRQWANGFMNYGVANSQIHALKPLFKQLVALANQSPLEANDFVEQVERFLRIIPRGGQYLKLLASNPTITPKILEPYINSPPMHILLEQSPYIIDSIIDASFDYQSDFVLSRNDFEWRIKRLRQFVNEQLYATMQQLLKGDIGSEQLLLQLTGLAEQTLRLALKITSDDMQIEQAPIDIIGLGKLGMQTMQPLSDLDLVFVSKDNADNYDGFDLEQIQRFTRRFQHVMEVKTKEGRAYEMDTRLRPSGKSGSVTVRFANFQRYHFDKARNWEHIAMVFGRVIPAVEGASSNSERQLSELIHGIITKSRQPESFKMDAAKMLYRVRQQRTVAEEQGDLMIKLVKGGVFDTDYLSACIQLLQLNTIDNSKLIEIRQFWNKVQTWSRMLGLETQSINRIPDHLQAVMFSDLGIETNFNELKSKVENNKQWIVSQLADLFNGYDEHRQDWSQWQENEVKWL